MNKKPVIRPPGKSIFTVRGAAVDVKLNGLTPDLVFLDEAADIKDTVWAAIEEFQNVTLGSFIGVTATYREPPSDKPSDQCQVLVGSW